MGPAALALLLACGCDRSAPLGRTAAAHRLPGRALGAAIAKPLSIPAAFRGSLRAGPSAAAEGSRRSALGGPAGKTPAGGPAPGSTGNAKGESRDPRGGATVRPEDKTLRDFRKSCAAEGCHAGLRDARRIHGPIAVGACQICHKVEGAPEDHRFGFARPKEDLCTFCHPPAEPKEFVHRPYGGSECMKCHDSHGGTNRNFLRRDTAAKTCEPCHERHEVAFSHRPVEEGDCLTCHAAHQSDYPRLLRYPEQKLCTGCHRDVQEELLETGRVHAPAAEACSSCHFSHGGEYPGLLCQEPQQLCAGCHEAIAADLVNAGSAHGRLHKDSGCSGCHTPHASAFDNLLVESQTKLCFRCHDRRIDLGAERKVANIREEIASAKFLHGPVAEGECAACHHLHSSPYRALLRGAYPRDSYADFSGGEYEACFSCHQEEIVTAERTRLTGFRDGDRNLHYVHVNRKKGRTCAVCHEPHGSQTARLLRQTFPFGPGKWELPINFVQTESGGACGSGCHKRYSYDNSGAAASTAKATDDAQAVAAGNGGGPGALR